MDEAKKNCCAPQPSYSQKVATLQNQLAHLEIQDLAEHFQLFQYDEIIKTTVSLCHDCLQHVPAVVYSLAAKVWMQKKCPQHGIMQTLLENDKEFYYLCNKDLIGKSYSTRQNQMQIESFEGCCGGKSSCGANAQDLGFADQSLNKTCTILVEVTNACNLACQVCYAQAEGDRILPLELFKKHIQDLIQQKGELDSVQVTGGEATLHPQFWDLLNFLYTQEKLKKIYLPTNGVLLADFKLCQKLKKFKEKLIVLLQFDGKEAGSNLSLRNRQTASLRDKVIQHCNRLKIPMQLTMTVASNINEHEIGWVLQTGLKNKWVKIIAFQPVTYSGRYLQTQDPLKRLCLSDIIKAIQQQAQFSIESNVFTPIPCSHPNCGWITLFVQRFGFTKNIVQYLQLNETQQQVAYKTMLSTQEIRKKMRWKENTQLKKIFLYLGKKLIRSQDSFVVAIKPFMDKFNYDQDRIANCCHHIMDTLGRPVSFCEYNTLLRPQDSWEKFPQIT